MALPHRYGTLGCYARPFDADLCLREAANRWFAPA